MRPCAQISKCISAASPISIRPCKAQLDLSRIHVKAPINGTVFDLHISEGALVERNDKAAAEADSPR